MEYLFLVIGFIVLIKGADLLVSGSVSLARRFNISELIIGLTVVAFGTSTPELIVNIYAARDGLSDVVLGNVIGSNLFNLLLILGITGIIYPIKVQSATIWKEIPFSLLAAVILILLCNDSLRSQDMNILTRWDGGILLLLFILFMFYLLKQSKKDSGPEKENSKTFGVSKSIILTLLGLTGLIFGGKLVVENAVEIARNRGISEKIIGIAIVSVGTSLPELATSLAAAFKRNSDIAIGNVIGSNIFNILLILGISALIRPIPYSLSFNIDIVLLSSATLLLFIMMFSGVRKKLDRWEAVVLVLFFAAYIVFILKR